MKHVAAVFLFGLISHTCLAACEEWTLEAENHVTHEVKTFKYHIGETAQVLLPDLKNFKCEFMTIEGAKLGAQSGSGANLICKISDDKNDYAINTGAACDKSRNGHGTAAITGRDKKTGKTMWFNFSFTAD